MNLPRFPDAREEAHRRAQELRELAPAERWAEVAALMAFGWAMVAASPRRPMIEQRMAEQEEEAQHIQRELFQRHGEWQTLAGLDDPRMQRFLEIVG